MRLAGDHGQVGGMEVIPFGVLVFVVGTLLMAHTWAVIDAKLAVVAAAREGSRTYVEGPVDGAVARQMATTAARDALEGHGRAGQRASIDFEPPDAAQLVRCQPITVVVRYPIPGIRLPWLGAIAGLEVSARHRELVDPYRDGIPGPADCG